MKLPPELAGSDDNSPLKLKDGIYPAGRFPYGDFGQFEISMRVAIGQQAGLLLTSQWGQQVPVRPDAGPPTEVAACVNAPKPRAGLWKQLLDVLIPDAHAVKRCVALMTTVNCFRQSDGTVTCYTFFYCIHSDGQSSYDGRTKLCGCSQRCPRAAKPGINTW